MSTEERFTTIERRIQAIEDMLLPRSPKIVEDEGMEKEERPRPRPSIPLDK